MGVEYPSVPSPEWKVWAGQHGAVLDHGTVAPPQFGQGAYTCSGCGRDHVMFAAFAGNLSIEVAISPDDALELAARIVADVERLRGKKVTN